MEKEILGSGEGIRAVPRSIPALCVALSLLFSACVSGGGDTPPACVVDIDGTLTGPTPPGVPDKFMVLEEGRQTLWRIHRRGVAIFYLTARPILSLEDTRLRQVEYDYPPGEIIMKEDGMEDTKGYKIRMIRRIQESHRVVFGIGDTEIDMEAYAACGITALHLKPSSNQTWIDLRPRIEDLLQTSASPAAGGE
ncbi:MAG: hypothetical protein NTV79_02055 [Candidatus Aureabacteria bacterium]|nr:hypothetical protein [Candidatus Auribacterota bacterium]